MELDALLDLFRRLGGTAENVRLGTGAFGRGVFAIDPATPIRLHLPPHLMVPCDALEVRDGALTAKPGSVPDDLRSFFDAYQRTVGWSAGGREESRAVQQRWHELPESVTAFVKTMGVLDHPDRRFGPPDDEHVFVDFVTTRFFHAGGRAVMIPMVDLVNHAPRAAGYDTNDGVGISGLFSGEVCVRYNDFDPFAAALAYSFADRSLFAYSVRITVELPGGKTLAIARDITARAPIAEQRIPLLDDNAGRLRLSFMPLGNLGAPDLPRGIFRALMQPYLDRTQSDRIFDGIAHFNRQLFINLLRLLRRHDAPLVRTLEEAAIDQLEALSASVGAAEISLA